MSLTITQVIGAEEAVKLVCRELNKRFAAPNKIPRRDGEFENYRRYGDVEIWFDMENVGQARFHCVTWDSCEMEVVVDFAAITREYLDDLMNQCETKLRTHRGNRSPLVVNAVASNDAPETVRAAVTKAGVETKH